MTKKEWQEKGERLFGKDMMEWEFVCPICGYVAKAKEWKAAGAPENAVAFSCVGRWIPGSKEAWTQKRKGPCNYAGGGLFKMNPLKVGDDMYFNFNEKTKKKEAICQTRLEKS